MKKIIYTLVSLMCLMSCDEDAFSTTLEVDPPDFQSLMVANVFMNNFTDSAIAKVGQTFPVLEDKEPEEVLLHDATIEILHDGMPFVSFVNTKRELPSYNYIGQPAKDLTPGETYELRVEHQELGTVSAQQVMPEPVTVESIKLVKDAGKDLDGSDVSAVEVTFQDPADVDNFYGAEIWIVDSINQSGFPVYSFSEEPRVLDGFGGIFLIEDQSFDGQTITLRFFVQPSDFQRLEEDGALVWYSLTRDYYLFSASLQRFSDGSGFEAFSEPALIHSNIDNGLGCFGLSHIEIVPFR